MEAARNVENRSAKGKSLAAEVLTKPGLAVRGETIIGDGRTHPEWPSLSLMMKLHQMEEIEAMDEVNE